MNTIPKTHPIGVRFFCLSCGFGTSGIILPDKDVSKRHCPSCKKILVWCQECHQYISSKIVEEKIVCGKCQSEIPEPHFNINKKS